MSSWLCHDCAKSLSRLTEIIEAPQLTQFLTRFSIDWGTGMGCIQSTPQTSRYADGGTDEKQQAAEVALDENTVVALYDFKGRAGGDLSFSKGDRMRVIERSDEDWWKVTHLKTNATGFIPANYVAEYSSVEAEE